MIVVPAINCADFDCVKEKLQKAAGFFSGLPADSSAKALASAEALAKAGWAQIDVADGKFTPHITWNNPEELRKLLSVRVGPREVRVSPRFVEVHLMIEEPQNVIDDWLKAGVKRIIVHFEAVKNSSDIIFIFRKCEAAGVEFGLAFNSDTPAEKILPYLDKIKFVQILAVDPGLSGQKFQPQVLDKIKFLKSNYPDVIIEIDGGINLEIAELCKEAGADILVSGSYIWNSSNPKEAFKKLSEL